MSHPHDATRHDEGNDEVPEPPVTGDPVVDEAVAELQYVTSVPVAEQPGIYESVHRALQDRLADVEG